MAQIDVYNSSKKVVGKAELSDAVFAAEVKSHLLHDVVVNQLANRRRGTQKAKTRVEVSGGGTKPWAQKGTGRARAGSSRSPLWRHGGVVFAPTPRDYSYKLPKKVRQGALKSAVAARHADGCIVVIDSFGLDKPKTKELANILKTFGAEKKTLIVTAAMEKNLALSARNIPNVTVIAVAGLNVYDVLRHETIIIAQDAIKALEARLGA